MKNRPIALLFSLLFAFVATLPALAKDPESKAATAEEKDGKKNVTTFVLTATPEAAHTAALQALAAIGCEIKKDSPLAIEGKRKNKVGLAVGSGGEKLFVVLKDLGNGSTEVTVTTKKTLVGIVGQKLWNEEVAKQIRETVK